MLLRSSPLLLFALVACSSPGAEPASPPSAAPVEGARPASTAPAPPIVGEKAAYFAGGCFWGVEHFMEKIDGVLEVESGFMGGRGENPSYEEVSSGKTGHLETVRVRYDPRRVGFEVLAKRFFEIHDPTQADGQGPDLGEQYLSAVFVHDDEERAIVAKLIEQLRARGFAVVTQTRPVAPFTRADDHHQDYYARNGKKPYCHAPVARFGD